VQIIPVIDLVNGTVVRARAGDRDHYRPIVTPLSPTSDPVDVAHGLLAIHPFDALYVADLDAITGRGDNTAALARLKARCPGLVLWVDSGVAAADPAEARLGAGTDRLVLGSESQVDAALARRLAGHDRVVLSLDFRGDRFQGPADLLADTSCWPRRIIAMTLARVGSGGGPDLDRLDDVKRAAGARAVFAAGGVRDAADLAALAGRGIAGALVATCLHDGRLTGADIGALADPAAAGRHSLARTPT
jgi:HisA/HisF family protein